MLALSQLGSTYFPNAAKSLLSTANMRRASQWIDGASTRVSANIPVIEAILSRLDPTLSLHRVLARVVAIREETHDVKTYVLRPNARFGVYRPGAYANVRVTIDGRPFQRAYSLSSPHGDDGLISITVKRVPAGVVSNHLADALRPGDVLELDAPTGQFVLRDEACAQLLMISAGSGITPVMSMLRHLVRNESRADISFLHFARTPQDIIFGNELARIARQVPSVKVVLCVEEAGSAWSGLRGRVSEGLIEDVVPNFRSADAYLCGPAGFMKAVMQGFEHAGADLSKLRYERFSPDFDASTVLTQSQLIRFTRSGVEAISNRAGTVLQEAEARGIRVDTGCRAGTCGTCRCRKRKGVVFNTATGLQSGDGEEIIYPCVSIARGTVEVDL